MEDSTISNVVEITVTSELNSAWAVYIGNMETYGGGEILSNIFNVPVFLFHKAMLDLYVPNLELFMSAL